MYLEAVNYIHSLPLIYSFYSGIQNIIMDQASF